MSGLKLTSTAGVAVRDATRPAGDVLTLVIWFYTGDIPPGVDTVFGYVSRSNGHNDGLYQDEPSGHLYADVGGTPTDLGTPLSANTWYGFSVRRNFGQLNIDSYAELDTSLTSLVNDFDSGWTSSVGVDDVEAIYHADGTSAVLRCRVWEAVLSDAEVIAELNSATAVRTSNLWAAWNMENDGTSTTRRADSSGNGRDLNFNFADADWSGSLPSLTSSSSVDPIQFLSPARLCVVAALPGSPSKGDAVVLDSDGRKYVYDGSAWVRSGGMSFAQVQARTFGGA